MNPTQVTDWSGWKVHDKKGRTWKIISWSGYDILLDRHTFKVESDDHHNTHGYYFVSHDNLMSELIPPTTSARWWEPKEGKPDRVDPYGVGSESETQGYLDGHTGLRWL